MRQWIDIINENASGELLLYHGTTPQKARSIIASSFTPRGAKNTFGKSVSFSDKPVGTRHYDKGAVIVYRLKPGAKLIDLQQFQREGRGDADGVMDNAGGPYDDKEVAIFNPASIEFVGWYNKETREVVPEEPIYSKDFRFNWNSHG